MIDAAEVDVHNPLGGFDFRLVKPTLEQKCWMVDLVIQKLETAASLANKYHINRNMLHKVVRRKLKGQPIRLKGGRPPVLDAISVNLVTEAIRENECLSKELLKQSIDNEYRATHLRRHGDTDTRDSIDEVPKNISRRTMRRYVNRLQPPNLTTAIGDLDSTPTPDIFSN